MTGIPESPLECPCDFPIKAIGRNSSNLTELVMSVIRRHVSDCQILSTYIKESGKGKYIAVTVTVRVSNKSVLDAIYRDLSKSEKIILVL